MVYSAGVDPVMAALRERAPGNLIDFALVMEVLSDFASPRSKLTQLLKSGALIGLKRGLYVFGPHFRRGSYCLEAIANVLFGPSYVSLERALHIYGIIPEYVAEVTSVTNKRAKIFQTPIGRFSYSHCHPKACGVGIVLRSFDQKERALIACPEKALVDLLVIRRGKIPSQKDLEKILLEDLRIEEDDLIQLDIKMLQNICAVYPHGTIKQLVQWMRRLR